MIFLFISLLIVFFFNHLLYKISDDSENALKLQAMSLNRLLCQTNTTLMFSLSSHKTRGAAHRQEREPKTRSCLVNYA